MKTKDRHANHRNADWALWCNEDGTYTQSEVCQARPMDIREELRALRRLLACSNSIGMPPAVRAIQRNTSKRKRRVGECR